VNVAIDEKQKLEQIYFPTSRAAIQTLPRFFRPLASMEVLAISSGTPNTRATAWRQ